MDFHLQKKLASRILKCSPKRVKIDADRMQVLGVENDSLKQAITKQDIRGFISDSIVIKKQIKGISRSRAKKRQTQKSKGRRRGHGSRKGVASARLPHKQVWMSTVRLQRALLFDLKEKKMITQESFKDLYSKCKGGFFRSKAHLKLYLEEHNLIQKK